MARVSVLGTGAWGTTLAQVLCDAGHEVMQGTESEDDVDKLSVEMNQEEFLKMLD